jgi:hypothetical protein
MASIGHHLVRRALDVTQDHFNSPDGSLHAFKAADEPLDDTRRKQLIKCGIVLVWITAILYFAVMSAVSLIRVAHFVDW